MGLAAQGYQVLEAPNGKAALDLLDLPANRYPHGAAAKADEGSTA
jgi:hypothetical protein